MKMRIRGLNKREVKKALLGLTVVVVKDGTLSSFFEKTIIESKKTERCELIHFNIVKGVFSWSFPDRKQVSGMEFYTMSISGDDELRGRVIQWFEEFLGDPFEIQEPEGKESADMRLTYIYWSAKKVDEKLKGG
ncbi:hypothetical protein KAS79_03310 [Candidatus Parcubacteria bacterium]|nr:hypothetical protein [Candidatus Parcubacteria bacterium]